MLTAARLPSPYLIPCIAIGLFLIAGVLLAPVLGVQNDEAVSVGAFHHPPSALGTIDTPVGELPLMQVSYAGALKSWIYQAVFAVFAPSKLSIRLPALLIGALTLWLFYLWSRSVASTAVASLSLVLLAVDPSFVITTCFDWGPVALQHLLFAGGVLAFARFAASQQTGWLLLGCSAFGLGIWDKALFAWMLSGAIGATVLVYRAQVRQLLTVRRSALGAAAFCLAAAPLLFYNLSDQGQTAASFEPQLGIEHLVYRLRLFGETLDGSALGRYMLSDPPECPLPFATPLPLLFMAALLATPWRGDASEHRLRRWAALAFLIAYPQTLIGKDVGVGAHHTVLLWPLPHLIVGGWLASWLDRGRARQTLAAGLAVLCVAANLAVLGSFVQRGYSSGPSVIWTTAIHPLRTELDRLAPQQINVLDWGVHDALRVLGQGEMPLRDGMHPFLDQAANCSAHCGAELDAPGTVFVDHTRDRRIFPQVRTRFDRYLERSGLQAVPISQVHDRLGRAVFEIFRLERAAAPLD